MTAARPIVVAALAAAASMTLGCASAAALTITRVVDGDTVKVSSGETVRIIGIDTPESVAPGRPVECGGVSASASMQKLAPAGSQVTLTADPTQARVDTYGRLLRYATVGGVDVGRAQVKRGLASVFVFGGVPFQRTSSYRKARKSARKHHRGVWRACGGDFHRPV